MACRGGCKITQDEGENISDFFDEIAVMMLNKNINNERMKNITDK